MITFDGVHKTFDETSALCDLSLEVPSGKTSVLIGPSGCGKSTALRLVLHLIEPDRGTVSFDGKKITTRNARDVRLRIGYVIQEGGLFPHMTARQNMTVMADHLNWNVSRIDDRVEQLVELTNFDADLLSSYPGELSGGQRQRVSLMRGLFLDPDALLLDEPLSALDPMIRSKLQDELRSIFQTLNKTVLLVTHDMNEASFFGDTIFLMNNGRLVQRGNMDQLLDQPKNDFVTSFIRAQKQLFGVDQE